jgi:hypothetical protein
LTTGGEGGVTCLHLLDGSTVEDTASNTSNGSNGKRILFGTQEGTVGALEVLAAAATASSPSGSAAAPMMELGSPVRCLARSPDGQRIAAATEYRTPSLSHHPFSPIDVSSCSSKRRSTGRA